jgi:hypothetical protein
MACTNKSTPGSQHIPRPSLETFVEYLPRPLQLGAFPPGPPRRACRPPHPPCKDRRLHRRRDCCRFTPARTVRRRAPASQLYQNPIKTLSEAAIGVVRRAKSRFPRLLERLRKCETEWTVWKGASRAQGSCSGGVDECDSGMHLGELRSCAQFCVVLTFLSE